MYQTTEAAYLPQKSGNRNYTREFILDIVNQHESGTSYAVLSGRYGISAALILSWMNRHGSELWHNQKKRSFTPLQKRTIVRAVVYGSMTERQAMQQYGIKNTSTIRSWKRKILGGNADLGTLNPPSLEEQAKPGLPAGNMESAEIKALKKALEASQMKVRALETLVDVAEDMFKIEIRKKLGARQSPK